VRVEFWGDEVTEMRMFSVADQRSITEIAVEHLVAVPCREVLLTEDVRARAATLAAERRAEHRAGGVEDMLAKLAEGIRSTGWRRCCRCCGPTTWCC
jgi:transcription-repair coupling factor (superfamily II helicase)